MSMIALVSTSAPVAAAGFQLLLALLAVTAAALPRENYPDAGSGVLERGAQ